MSEPPSLSPRWLEDAAASAEEVQQLAYVRGVLDTWDAGEVSPRGAVAAIRQHLEAAPPRLDRRARRGQQLLIGFRNFRRAIIRLFNRLVWLALRVQTPVHDWLPQGSMTVMQREEVRGLMRDRVLQGVRVCYHELHELDRQRMPADPSQREGELAALSDRLHRLAANVGIPPNPPPLAWTQGPALA